MFKWFHNKFRKKYILNQYYQNKIDIGKIKKGSIWFRSKHQPTYICLQYPMMMIDTAGVMDKRVFKVYKGQEFSDIVLGCLYKNGDPKFPFMRYIENPQLAGEVIGIVDLGNKMDIDDMDFLIRRNIRLE
jgi:hypothetical protein